MGLRLQLRRAQAEAGDIALLFGDESEALTPGAFAARNADPTSPMPGRSGVQTCACRRLAETRSVCGWARRARWPCSACWTPSRARRWCTRPPPSAAATSPPCLACWTAATARSPGRPESPSSLFSTTAPSTRNPQDLRGTSKASQAALAARSAWLTVEWLPRHAPELNAIETTWRDLKRHHLAHQTFRSADELDSAIHQAVANLNKQRSQVHPCHNLSMAA